MTEPDGSDALYWEEGEVCPQCNKGHLFILFEDELDATFERWVKKHSDEELFDLIERYRPSTPEKPLRREAMHLNAFLVAESLERGLRGYTPGEKSLASFPPKET